MATAMMQPSEPSASLGEASRSTGPAPRKDIILQSFEQYRSEIDAHNDRRERLIKASRDVTNLSKKLIFLLHRAPAPMATQSTTQTTQDSSSATAPRPPSKSEKEVQTKIDEVVHLIIRVAFEEGLDTGSQASDRYERNFGSGVEEFIEAVSFHHYLTKGNLMSMEEVQDLFRIDGEERKAKVLGSDGNVLEIPRSFLFPIPIHRYLLGISDLTGELMRFATNALGSNSRQDPTQVVASILSLLRQIREALDPFIFLVRDMGKKQSVTIQSMKKIEDLSYQLSIRTSEFGGDQKVIREMLKRALDGGSGGREEAED